MGLGDWIAIFKGGKQRDSMGREHDGDVLIDKAITKFAPRLHEPPVVIGHQRDNAPAYGWVSALKKEGGILWAKFRDVVPEFSDLAKRGLFKKRSAAFGPDGSLHHVAFLGAMPPAVKGLPDIAFQSGGESIWFSFNDTEAFFANEQDAAGDRIAARVNPKPGPAFSEIDGPCSNPQDEAGRRIAAYANRGMFIR